MHDVRRSKRSSAIHLRLAAGASCIACCSLVPARADAQSEPAPSASPSVPDALEYLAPAGCPDRDEWLVRVRERLADAGGDWSVARLAAIPARVALSASGTEARIVFHQSDTERSIAGADCEEVSSAAALIFAVALGPSGPALAPAPAPNPPSPRSSLAPAAATGRGQLVQTTVNPRLRPNAPRVEARVSTAPPTNAIDARIDAPPLVSSPADRRRWSVTLGAAAEVNAWTGPWPAGVVGISLDAVSPSRSWSARAAGSYGSSERVVDGRRAEFRYWGGHLDLCPIALGALTTWRWVHCAELHLGALQAEGDERSALASGSSQQALLATAVATTRITTPPLWVLRLQVETGVALPLLGQTFQFGAPEQVIFESPAVGLLARAGVLVPLDGQRD